MVLHAIVDYARRLDSRKERKHNIPLFVANLVDMYLAALSAEVSAESLSIVSTQLEQPA
jgi:hypothetical protein